MRSSAGPSFVVLFGSLLLFATVFVACGDAPTETSAHRTQSANPSSRYDRNGVHLHGPKQVDRGPNIVVIVIDTLRADAVLRPDGSPGVMPYFHELSQQGLCATRAFAPAAWTEPSMTSMLTGLSPQEHGCVNSERLPRLGAAAVTYAEVLRNSYGYETAAFTDARWFRGQPWSVLQGFARGSITPPRKASPMGRPMERGFGFDVSAEVLDDWLSARDPARPFCLLLHTFDAHHPYGKENRPPRSQNVARDEAALRRAIANYPVEGITSAQDFTRVMLTSLPGHRRMVREHGRRYADRVVSYMASGISETDGPFLDEMREAYNDGLLDVDRGLRQTVDALRKRGLLENTLLVVTSDHGEAFGEHQTLGHAHHLYAEVAHVPLVMLGPAPFDRPRKIEGVSSFMDVFPTFFDWAGYDLPVDIRGCSLLRAVDGKDKERVVEAETLVTAHIGGAGTHRQQLMRRSAEWTFLITYDVADGTVSEQLYAAADYEERHDLAVDGVAAGKRLPDSFCHAVDAARDIIWSQVHAAEARTGTTYGAGIGPMQTSRPAPCQGAD